MIIEVTSEKYGVTDVQYMGASI